MRFSTLGTPCIQEKNLRDKPIQSAKVCLRKNVTEKLSSDLVSQNSSGGDFP